MKVHVGMIALLAFASSSARAQSDEAKRTLNDQIASTWQTEKGRLEEAIARGVQEAGGGGGITRASIEFLDLKSPPRVEELNPSRISLKVPAGEWGIRIKVHAQARVRVHKRIKITKKLSAHVALKRLQARIEFRLDPSRPRVLSIRPTFQYQLDIDSSNLIVDVIGRWIEDLVNSRITKRILEAIASRYTKQFVSALAKPPPTPTPKGSDCLSSVDFAVQAARMRDTVLLHHLPHDTVVDAKFLGSASTPFEYGRHGDSAIYTGHWLAAQSMAFGVTSDRRYEEAATRALRGIARLLRVGSSQSYYLGLGPIRSHHVVLRTSHQGRLVRYAAPAAEREEEYRQESARTGEPVPVAWIDGEKWVGDPKHITRDQYVGVLQGLTWATAMLKDPRARLLARDLAERIANYVVDNGWKLDRPDGKTSATFVGQVPHQLALLLMGSHTSFRMQQILEKEGSLAEIAWFNSWLHTLDPHGDYYKLNLLETSLSTLLHFDMSAQRQAKYKYAQKILWRAIAHHENPYFATVAAMADPKELKTLSPPIPILLKQWLRRPMHEGMPCDLVLEPMRTYWAAQPKKEYAPFVRLDFEGDDGDGSERISETGVPMEYRPARAYMWSQSPYRIRGGQLVECAETSDATADLQWGGRRFQLRTRDIELTHFPAVDFQLAYWLARYRRILK